MKNIFHISCLLALLCLLGSCSTFYRTVQIKDVSKPEKITLSKRPLQKHVYHISIQVAGKLDGTTASIALTIDGKPKPYLSEKMHNSVNFQWKSDWYSDVAVIQYKAIDVKSGNLTLYYRFSA
ncbi:hypothetical protein NIES4073_54410 [Kalymmatonema gypsitolerans NIES-4073]|nr:hypothetical protein NIES4073_54410 [Scytonema sp. NIES-4073]